MDIFRIPANDQSIYYLGQIFGYMGGLLPVDIAKASLIVGTMFKTFNTMALVLGSVIVVYTTVVGLFATAHEGEFLGKKWNSLWVPLRTIMGIVGLFPSSSGYSLLQVIMMWCVIQGIGAADTLWTTVLTYLQATGTPYAAISMPAVGAATTTQQLFQSLVCQAETRVAYAPPNGPDGITPQYYCSTSSSWKNDWICSVRDDQMLDITGEKNKVQVSTNGSGQKTYRMGPEGGGKCGSLTYCDKDVPCGKAKSNPNDLGSAVACAACTAQETTLQKIVTLLGGYASNFAAQDVQYATFYETPGGAPRDGKPAQWILDYCTSKGIADPKACCRLKRASSPLDIIKASAENPGADPTLCSAASFFYPDFIVDNADYTNSSGDAVANIYWPFGIQPLLKGTDFIKASVDLYNASIISAVTKAINQGTPATFDGWKQTAQNNGWIFAGAYYYQIANMNKANVQGAIPDYIMEQPKGRPDFGDKRTNFASVNALIKAMSDLTQSKSNYSSAVPPEMQQLTGNASALIEAFMSNLSQNATNPLSSLQAYGEAVLITAQILFALFLAAAILLVTLGSLKAYVLGTGVDTGIGQGLAAGFMLLMPAFLAFIAALIVFGGLLAVYTPLIPFILFTMAALGWMIGVIEAMVAAPMIALGILSPGGQHEIMGKAEPALLLLLNVVLRPSLMIFGMIIAMLFAVVAVKLVNSTFLYVIRTILPNPGLPEFIMILAAYCFLIISVLNKCFSLIHLIPERVLTWIGGQAVTYGEEQALGEVKKGVEQAGGATAGAVGAIAPSESSSKHMGGIGEGIKKHENDKKAGMS